jgi:ribokinase
MAKAKIAVFGSFVVDLTGWAGHLPAAGETVFGEKFKMGPGGKGSNQAVAAHRAGADVTFITKVGKDPFADIATNFYKSEGMDVRYILTDGEKSTGIALICVDEQSGQNQILVVPGACTNFTDADIELVRPVIEASDYLLLQFEVNMDALEKVMDLARARGVKIILNTAPVRKVSKEFLRKADIVTPNEVEAAGLLNMEVKDEADAKKACDAFHAMGIGCAIITMGKAGVFASANGMQRMVPSFKVDAIDTTGAGDAFNGAFVAALAEGMDVFQAVEFGNKAGALSVTKIGTAPAMPLRREIDAFQSK